MTLPAPPWRSQPYRLFFPLGVALCWAGVLHWFLHGVGYLEDYRPVFHAITQIQGFMMCFAVGFLYTAIPRRTGTAAPSPVEMLVAFGAPIVTTAAAWSQRIVLSQLSWLVLVLCLLQFAGRRFVTSRATRRPPVGFVWIPLALLMGVGGSIAIAAREVLGDDYYHLLELGRLYLLQGMFLGLVIGVGGMVLPLIGHGASTRDFDGSRRDWWLLLAHAAAALLLAASFWIEGDVSLTVGLGLRSAIALVMLLAAGGIGRPPSVPGWHRWLVWAAAWMIPIGYAVAAAFPAEKKAGLHVVLIGGFALMAFSVGLHVTLAHGGRRDAVRGRSVRVVLFGGMFLMAVGLRALVDFDREHFSLWIAASSAVLLLGTLAWASLALPALFHVRGPD